MFSTKVLNDITSAYTSAGAIPDELQALDVTKVETEIRFGELRGRTFRNGISFKSYKRLDEFFRSGNKLAPPVSTLSTEYIRDYSQYDENGQILVTASIRKTVTDNSESMIYKRSLWSITSNEYPYRLSVSQETPIVLVEPDSYTLIRTKNRTSYLVFNGSMRMDLTEVDVERLDDGSREHRYEVELELLDVRAVNLLQTAVTTVLKSLLDTVELYSQSERFEFVNYFNATLASRLPPLRERSALDYRPLVQARNLKIRDMVWGGLIGNTKTSYTITHKTDGIRKLLVINNRGIWMVMPPYDICKISSAVYRELAGYILDGEYLPPGDKYRRAGAPNSRIWFLVFDCISQPRFERPGYDGDDSIQDLPHVDRMNSAQVVSDRLKGNLLHVDTKSFYEFTNAEELFSRVRRMFREIPHLAYHQDGFMFTPSNIVYNPHSDNFPLTARVLTRMPDICKWKPKEQLTIDLIIQHDGENVNLYATNDVKPGLVRFVGDKNEPFKNQLDLQSIEGLPDGTIVEFGWDYNRGSLYMHKVRLDKRSPNRIDIVLDVWADIHNPISEEIISGETFTFLRKYHNRIKRNLYNEALSMAKSDKTLLDIGSGRGGDVAKWTGYSRIVAVEPNAEHILELERRLENIGIRDRVRIVNAGGQDTALISAAVREFIGGRVSTVSTMLSLSFFWQDSSLVNSLLLTILTNIQPDGNYIFLTIDGDSVDQSYQPALKSGLSVSEWKMGPATLIYDDSVTPPTLKVNIENSIVRDQTEWLVRTGDLIAGLSAYGFNYKYIEAADKERFLSLHENVFTQLFSYGLFSREDSSISLPEPNYNTDIIEVKPDLLNDRGLGDDTYLPLEDNLVRISTINDNNSLYHALLKAVYPPYADTSSFRYRSETARLVADAFTDIDSLRDWLGLDILIREAGRLNRRTERSRWVILNKIGNHYETVAYDNGQYFVTIFTDD